MRGGIENLIFICSPYNGREEEYRAALSYAQFAVSCKKVPIVPQVTYHNILNCNIPLERNVLERAAMETVCICSEVWVFTKAITPDMQSIITVAQEKGIPVLDKSEKISYSSKRAETARAIRFFEKTFCNLSRVAVEDICAYIDYGICAFIIEEAIKAADRKNAGWVYARSILERCKRNNILTQAQWEEGCAAKKSRASPSCATYNMSEFMDKLYGEK